jgi:hypothetical protein
VLGVGDRVTDDVLEEDLEDTASLLVDEARDTLDTATTSETTDCGLGDTLDVVTKLWWRGKGRREGSAKKKKWERETTTTHNLAVTLGSSLAESLSSLSAAGHD